MIIPLVNAKVIINNDNMLEIQYVSNMESRYKFFVPNMRKFIELKPLFQQEKQFNFITSFNGKVYTWRGTIGFVYEKERVLLINEPVITEVKDDIRKERISVKDKLYIKDIQFDNRYIDLQGRLIPAIVKNISESGILFYSNLDFSELEKYDNQVTVTFEGELLKDLQYKKLTIRRIFKEGDTIYYGCQFNIQEFEDMRQINRIIQDLKKKD